MRALLALVVPIAMGCNAVLGLDERPHSETDAFVDASTDTIAVDTSIAMDTRVDDPRDSAPSLDTSAPDTATSSLLPCAPACGSKERCIITWNVSGNRYTWACVPGDGPVSGGPLSECTKGATAEQYTCAEGYACGILYPDRTACFPLCSDKSPCATVAAPYCIAASSVTLEDGLRRCSQCNPYVASADCGSSTRCTVTSLLSAPTCTDVDGSTGGLGMPCKSARECAFGYVCDCSVFGAPRIGNDCATDGGTCRKLCLGTGCSGGSACTPLGSTAYAVCK